MTVVAYDTEFLEGNRTLDLISIGLVREDGAEYYAVNSEANWAGIGKHRWLCENVVPHLPLVGKGIRETQPNGPGTAKTWQFAVDTTDTRVKPAWVIANEVREFILTVDEPQLWADYGAYDHVALCWLWGTMTQLPGGIPMWTHDLRQELERAGNPPIPPLGGMTSHNALDDAREVAWQLSWLREHAA
jgi:hypothetical protein